MGSREVTLISTAPVFWVTSFITALRSRFLAFVFAAGVAFPIAAVGPAGSYTIVAYPGGGTNTAVYGVNDLGHAVGVGYDGVGNWLGSFVYDIRKGTFQLLSPIPDAAFGEFDPIAINDLGTIVGAAYSPDYSSISAFILDHWGHYTIFTHPNSPCTDARGVNVTGLVVGVTCTPDGTSFFGYLYDSSTGKFTDIQPANALHPVAAGINAWGWTVGSAGYPADWFYPGSPETGYGWLRSPSGQLTLFLVNGSNTQPRGINDLGQITGYVNESACGCAKGYIISVGQVFDANKHATGFGTVTVPESALFVPDGKYAGLAEKINNWGVVVGITDDANFNYGFIRWPSH